MNSAVRDVDCRGRDMTIVYVLLILVAVAVVAMVAAGKIGQLADPVVDRYRPEIPNAPLAASDIAEIRIATSVRGYRMSDVDDVLDRLIETLRIREAQLAALSPQQEQADDDELVPVAVPASTPDEQSA